MDDKKLNEFMKALTDLIKANGSIYNNSVKQKLKELLEECKKTE